MFRITKDEENLIIKIPLKAKRSNPYDESFEDEMDSICGVIAGDEEGFAHWIDMDYKGKSDQVSEIFLKYYGDDFKEKCKELGIEVVEYPICAKCGKAIYGTFTWDEGEEFCYDCVD